uniref:Uncharacterized protein n=1 Tax=Arundo donax TaxID=35708 RepID=A0A0A9B2N4_ARUDO
MPSKGVMVA